MTTRISKKTSTKKAAKRSAAPASAKLPTGARSTGEGKSPAVRTARAATPLPQAPLKRKAPEAPAAKAKAVAKPSRAVAVNVPHATPKKKPSRKRQVQALAASSVAPEMAAAMLGEMSGGHEDAVLEREAAREQRERDVLGRLAVAMHRHDDMPNQELAANIVFHLDREAISVLVGAIERHDDVHGPDAARVLCEVGTRDPELIACVQERLIALCQEGASDMLPFAMFSLSPIAHRLSDQLWEMRDLLWSVLADGAEQAEMARAAAVRLLSSLCAAGPDYARTLAGGLVDLLGKCMPKDVALYAESVLPALGAAHSHRAKPVLDRRMKELTPAEVARLRRAVRVAQTMGMSVAA